ncbi:hypothetical protein [Rhodococcus erythropolis]|uniref:hypothetical protein n=1 Tax=Rhodococcus erythropolis TaxID=1833 RepID=UPI0018A2B887|nr:hypothetical protein [Rhodococcus erythropolis]MBF7737233.1 hypothetical protein [Rhodococcus erythropolis]MCZ4640092.1 hypothetical protein [Rhodococcus erythropolis]
MNSDRVDTDRMNTEDDSTTVLEFLQGGAPAPALPNNTVESMLAGIPVPALPGIEDLFAPLIELGKSLGTGTFAGTDPVGIFNQASTLIDQAMGLSQSAVAEVGQTWNSTGSEAATELSRSAQNSGAELSERGTAISKTAAAAAESVQRGNANLAAIAQSFATTVAAAAPIAWTPPGQAMLIASAAEHMQAAVAAVTQTRGEMLGHTAAMNALAGSIPVPTPPIGEALANLATPEALADAARQIAQPLAASAVSASPLSGSTDAGDAPFSTHSGADAVRTSAAQAGAGLPTGVDKLWGAGNSSTSLAAGGSPSPSATASSGGAWVGGSGTTGGTMRGAAGVAAVQPVPVATPGLGAPSSAVGSSGISPGGMMGGGPRGTRDDESSRTTPGYLVSAGDENSMVDDLPMVSPPVLGAENPDQYLFRDL